MFGLPLEPLYLAVLSEEKSRAGQSLFLCPDRVRGLGNIRAVRKEGTVLVSQNLSHG